MERVSFMKTARVGRSNRSCRREELVWFEDSFLHCGLEVFGQPVVEVLKPPSRSRSRTGCSCCQETLLKLDLVVFGQSLRPMVVTGQVQHMGTQDPIHYMYLNMNDDNIIMSPL